MPIQSLCKLCGFFAFCVIGMLPVIAASDSNTDHNLRFQAAAMLVYGSTAANNTSGNTPGGYGDLKDFSALYQALREALNEDSQAKQETMKRAYLDAFGITPQQFNESQVSQGSATYFEQLTRYLEQLQNDPAEYEKVIGRACQWVIFRDPYQEEIDYWKKKGVLSYAALVGCVEDWARRNQPGLMVINGTPTVSINCEFLSALRLTPAIAEAIRTTLDYAKDGSAGEGRIIAPGAEKLTSSGGIHMILTGSSELRQAAGE